MSLPSGYRYSGTVVADTVEKLLLARQLGFEVRDDLWRVLHRYREGPAAVADDLIGQRNRSNGRLALAGDDVDFVPPQTTDQ